MGKKIGEGHFGAMMRQGLRELRGAMYPDSNVAQQPEYGLYGTKTPGEVAEGRREPKGEETKGQEKKGKEAKGKEAKQDVKNEDKAAAQPSVLDDREREAESRSSDKEAEKEKGMDLER